MATENNDGNKGPIEDQVKHLLSGLGGEVGEFLSHQKTPEEEVTIAYLLKKLKEEEQINNCFRAVFEQDKLNFKYVQALANDYAIKISHLKVENGCLRRELDRLRAGEAERTQTALDFEPPKRHWTFWNRNNFKGFRLIGGTGEGK